MKLNYITDKALTSLLDTLNKFKEHQSFSYHKEETESWPWPQNDDSEVEFKSNTEAATMQGIRFIHVQNRKHRCTIAYRPTHSRGNMIDVAVAYVHPNEQFNKKTGANLAAERFMKGNYVTMPLRNKDKYVTYWNIVNTFSGIQ